MMSDQVYLKQWHRTMLFFLPSKNLVGGVKERQSGRRVTSAVVSLLPSDKELKRIPGRVKKITGRINTQCVAHLQ